MAERSEAKTRSEASRHNIYFFIFDAKLRFALFASLRLIIFTDKIGQIISFFNRRGQASVNK
jgi:hypothetical protein